WYQAYPNTPSNSADFGEKYRVVRGGSWIDNRINSRATNRNWDAPTIRDFDVGFRCVNTF
ncbi:MAG TPA: ergothioneine biosynthesis protein EgtB, partial [Anaerolineae bacterium]|nr:ergothioneine biosynthesis protein EgtB [Anaerolineae bacterium]